MNMVLAIFIGGGLGSLARFGISSWVGQQLQLHFPVATLLSNLLSCGVLALTVGLFHEKLIGNDFLNGLLVVGFCGGFSTFSAFSYETLELIRSGNYFYASANVLVSVFLCLFVLFLVSRHA